MTDAEWSQIKSFSRNEAWGDPSKMCFPFVQELDRLRQAFKFPIRILCGTQGKHVDGSTHYEGKAVDLMAPTIAPNELFDFFLLATRFGFKGVGVYPMWKLGERIVGGLHLDWRDTPTRAYWMGVGGSGAQEYIALNGANLARFGLF